MSKLQIAGRELMKGNIGNAIQVFAAKSYNSELIQPARYRNGNFFFGVNGADKAFIWGNWNSGLVAYQSNPIVSAVINRKAQAIVNGDSNFYDNKGEVSKTKQADALRKLFMSPNPLQTGMQFEAQGSVYKQIYGYCPVLIIRPIGYEADFSKWKMWNIPPWMLLIQDNPDFFFNADDKPFQRITLSYMGHTAELNADNVLFLKENQISTSTYQMNSTTENASIHLPDSKLLPLQHNIDNLNASLDSRGSIIRNRGPLFVLTNDSNDGGETGLFPMDQDVKEELKTDFSQYGIMKGQQKAIITDAKLKLQQVGFNVAELQLNEGEVQDAKFICDGLNYPPYLLGLVDSKFDNQAIAERAFYLNSIIPDSQSEDEQWTVGLGLDKYGLVKKTDFSHLAALQEDAVKRATARMIMNQACTIEYQAGLITKNMWLSAIGLPAMGPEGDYRSTEVKSNQPLATSIGVGGVQSVLQILTAAGLGEEARANILNIVFGIDQVQAASMVIAAPVDPSAVPVSAN